ncbi:hypothetical protein PAECIP111802_02673 [Paenibacillus allorhizosphaerae]|uniref:HAMP domain-containing protein n=1 Tax=Paenibacillus allorhizosphaerae TaxID=2849866 RepID=A0ABM8VH44_9BACL|nr:hypothetical protein PAECIP111802_02673 [Paenibacillus allorhizosphaerae]
MNGILSRYKRLIPHLVLLALLVSGVVYGWDNYLMSNPFARMMELKDLTRVTTDNSNNIYIIMKAKNKIVKIDAAGNIVYVINQAKYPAYTFIDYTDISADAKGNLYALRLYKEYNGFLVRKEEIVRYTAEGKLDTGWKPYVKEFPENSLPVEGSIHAIVADQNDLYYYDSADDQSIGRYKMASAGGVSTLVDQLQLPSGRHLNSINGTDLSSTAYSTHQGELYSTAEGKLYPLDNEPKGDSYPEWVQMSKDHQVYFVDQYGQSIKKVNPQQPGNVETLLTKEAFDKLDEQGDNINDITIRSDGKLILATNSKVYLVAGHNQLVQLTYSPWMRLIHVLYGALLLATALLVLWILVILWNLKEYSLITKQMMYFIPVILLFMFFLTQYATVKFKTHLMEEVDRKLIFLAHDGQNLIDSTLLDRIHSAQDFGNDAYRTIQQKMSYADNFSKFYWIVYKIDGDRYYQTVESDNNFRMFEGYSLDNTGSSESCQSRDVNGVAHEAKDYRGLIKGDFYACSGVDQQGSWRYAIGPLFNADKSRVIGFYETGINTFATNQRVSDINRMLIGFSAGMTMIMIALCIFIIRRSVTPIILLQESAGLIAQGHWDLQVSIDSKDEVASLGKTFNGMAASIRRNIAEITDFKNASYRFVPQEYIHYLGKKSILEIQLGDQLQQDMTILMTNIRSFYSLSKSMSPGDSFSFMNAYLNRFVPAVSGHNGIINKYLGSGIFALFPSSAEMAIQSAIEMRKVLDRYNAERKQHLREPIEIGIGIHKGPLMLGIIGEKTRMEGNVISEDVNLAVILEKLTEELGATILVTEETLLSVTDPAKFFYRDLGVLQVSGVDQPMRLFDIFEGDSAALFELKLHTKELFDQGIAHYQKGEFMQAREIFLNVIRHNRWDLMAKRYFFESDKLSQSTAPAGWGGALRVS